MPYSASIDRTNPGCFLFLVDQSSSMSGTLAGQRDQRKMEAAADAVNRVLDNVAQRCSRGMEIRDYFDVGILGYGFALEVPYDETKEYYVLVQNEGVRRQNKNDSSWKQGPFYEERIVSVLPDTTPERPFLALTPIHRRDERRGMVKG